MRLTDRGLAEMIAGLGEARKKIMSMKSEAEQVLGEAEERHNALGMVMGATDQCLELLREEQVQRVEAADEEGA